MILTGEEEKVLVRKYMDLYHIKKSQALEIIKTRFINYEVNTQHI